jgi:rRNA maturation RNase YbeY
MNKEFLQHDELTDIITFDLSDKNAPKIADVYISIDRVRENAKSNNVSLQTELLRVIFHGALHLAGFKDKTKRDKLEMRARENYYLKKFESA